MFLLDLLAFFLVLTPIVLAHELGHFIMAIKNGVRVEEFGVGLPPRALKLFERHGTVYSLNWIPLGGFVRPVGEDDPTVPGGLAGAPKRARFLVLVAGSSANILLAFVLFWIAFVSTEVPLFDESTIEVQEVTAGDPAELAGLQAGDIVRQVDGVAIDNTDTLVQLVQGAPEKPLVFLVERQGETLSLTLVPLRTDAGTGRIGAALGAADTGQTTRFGILRAAVESGRQIWRIVTFTLRVPLLLVQGQISARDVGLVGPPSIARGSRQAAQISLSSGNWYPFLSFVGFINVALGFTNLLPLPALDGGRIFFVLIEALRGRRIEPEREALVHVVGMAVLLAIMALVFVNDLLNPINLFPQ